MNTPSAPRIIKNKYYSNWGDIFGYPLAHALLGIATRIPFLTPNIVTLTAFTMYTLGSISLFLTYPFHEYIAAFLVIGGFVGDDLDGQLARAKKMSSKIGDYMDKVLDIIKIFIISASLGYAVYLQTNNIVSIYLGFTACFFFIWRYYIKLETMFARINHDKDYLEKSSDKRRELEAEVEGTIEQYKKEGFSGFVKSVVLQNRTIFFVDEAEFAIFTGIGAIFHRMDIALWIIAVAQVIIAFLRVFERGYQISTDSPNLLYPMRK
jgi:phosphatidylglycerophosphate synthase